MTAYNPSIPHASTRKHIGEWIADAARRAVEAASSAYRRRKPMRELESLDDRMLRDIGLQRGEIGSVVAELMGATPATRKQVPPSTSGGVAK